MKPLTTLVAAVVLCAAGSAAAQAQTAEASCQNDGLNKLAASVERLVVALESELKARAQDADSARMQVVLSALDLRYKKVDDLATQIRSAESDEEMVQDRLSIARARSERLNAVLVAAAGSPKPEEVEEKAAVDVAISVEQGRLARLGEHKAMLQTELGQERKRSADLEAILEAWIAKSR